MNLRSYSACLFFRFRADVFYVHNFTKLRSEHSVFAFNSEIIQAILHQKLLILINMFVCIVIQMQWFYCFMHFNSFKGTVRKNRFKSVCFDKNHPLGHKLPNKLKKNS